ncbi:hypothetical protein DICA3_D03906 [Diutina catenulata]
MDLPIYQEHWTSGRRAPLDIKYEYGIFKLLQEAVVVVQHRDQNWSQLVNGQAQPLRLFSNDGETIGYLVENYSWGSSLKSQVVNRRGSSRPFTVEVYDHEWNLVLFIKQSSSWDRKETIKVYLPGNDQYGLFHPKIVGKVDISGHVAHREYTMSVFDVGEETFVPFGHISTSPKAHKFAVRTEQPGQAESTIGAVDIDWIGLNKPAFNKVPIYNVRFDMRAFPGIDKLYHNVDNSMLMYDMRAVLLGAAISLDHTYFSKMK